MTAPAGWISLQLDASGPAWISVLECDGTEAVHVATDAPQATGERRQAVARPQIAGHRPWGRRVARTWTPSLANGVQTSLG